MKDNIKTAEDILNQHIFTGLEPDNIYKYNDIYEAMKEYAEQFIDLAAEEAKTDYEPLFKETFVSKESILKVKQLIK